MFTLALVPVLHTITRTTGGPTTAAHVELIGNHEFIMDILQIVAGDSRYNQFHEIAITFMSLVSRWPLNNSQHVILQRAALMILQVLKGKLYSPQPIRSKGGTYHDHPESRA